ncbi:hypothetical protein OHA45_27530 [Streptomyces lydicus]|uniref:hypothetical protein n=1 Tax=Streptomyces lydicus TaxID=47763 RepID=UPI002E31224C|nr:hypothetical protein [Streptomyces lydicus]
MQVSVVAIIVASVSALFTGANMLVSVLNYRRTRPRVRVLVTYNIIERRRVASPDQVRNLFRVHVINRSQTDTTITGLHLYCRYTVNWRTLRGEFARVSDEPAELTEPEADLDYALPAFGGLRFETEDLSGRQELRGKARPVAMTIRVTLADGTQVRGRWIRARELDRKGAWAQQAALDS